MVCLLGLSACNAETPVDPELSSRLQSMSQAIIEGALAPLDEEQASMLTSMGAEYMEYVFENSLGMKVNGNGMVTGFDSWNRAISEIGAFKEITGYNVKYNSKGDGIIVQADVTCENGDGQVEIIYEDDLNNTVNSVAFNVNYTFGEKMGRAGLNTLLGMGTVFVVLILISIIISLFNYIPKIQEIFAKDKFDEAAAESIPEKAEEESEDLTDDSELVAVISAAIAAYEQSTKGSAVSARGADDFVVRSIIRRK